jgi:hypothetical protein
MSTALKHRTRYLTVWLAFILGGFVCSQPAGAGQTLDNGIYAGLRARHVQDGVVDCGRFKAEEQRLDALKGPPRIRSLDYDWSLNGR